MPTLSRRSSLWLPSTGIHHPFQPRTWKRTCFETCSPESVFAHIRITQHSSPLPGLGCLLGTGFSQRC